MSADHLQAPDAAGFTLDLRRVAAFARFSGGYWPGAGAGGAWVLTLGLSALLVLSIAAAVTLNHWTGWLFNALEKRNVEAVVQAVYLLPLIIAVMAAVGVGIVLTRETLQVQWRAW